jgi:hypothetical protein
MRIYTNTAEKIETSLPANTRQGRGGIKSDFRLFFHLVDSLYSDKWDAICRELMSNCKDIHTRIGQTRPFEVVAPTAMNPTLSFIDYGTGLTDDFVLDCLFVIGETSKENAAAEIGGFGAGLKSVFSKSKQVTVESRLDGIKTIFSAYIGEDTSQPPTIDPVTKLEAYPPGIFVDILGKVPTNDPNGLTISIPVPTEEFAKVNEVIAKRAWRFVPQPITNVKLPQRRVLIHTELFTMRESSHTYGSDNTAQAVMGGIAYPIDLEPLKLPYSSPVRRLLQTPIDLQFEMGEVFPTMNRERLNYQPHTISNVIAKAEKVISVLREEVQKKIETAATHWDAIVLWRKEVSSETRNLLDRDKPTYKGKPLDDYFEPKSPNHSNDFCRLEGKRLSFATIPLDSWSRDAYVHPQNTVLIHWPKDSLISRPSASRRLRDWGISKHRDVVIFRCDPTEMAAMCGDGPVLATIDDAQMPDPGVPKQSRITTTSSGPRKVLAKCHRYDTTYSSFKETEVDLDEGGLFITTRNWEPECPEGYEGPVPHISLLTSAVRQHLCQDLIVFPATYRNLPKKYEGWVNALPLLKAKAIELSKDRTLATAFAARNAASQRTSTIRRAINAFEKLEQAPTKKHSVMGRLWAEHLRLKNLSTFPNYDDTTRLVEQFNLTLAKPKGFKSNFADLVASFDTTYPLLRAIEQTYASPRPSDQDWVDYINRS